MNTDLYNLKIQAINKIETQSHDRSFSIEVNYHGIPLQFHCPTQRLADSIRETLPQSWLTQTLNPYDIYLYTPQELGISPEAWCDESSQDCFLEEGTALAIQRDFIAKELESSEVLLISDDELGDGLYNFLRWFLPKKLLATDQFVIHSSCIVGRDGKARFFLGHSGAGKSTVAGLAEERKILGDDMNLFNFKDNQAMAGAIGGIFFSGVDYCDTFDVEGFYWLEQSDNNTLSKMSSSSAHTKLMASITNLFWDNLEEEVIQEIMDKTYSMAQNYPMYKLSFTKTTDFWDLIDGPSKN